jgi:inositol 1,4,5-triphosphate receptor type 1
LKGIHLISIMGNQGTFTKNFKQMVTDAELLYHFAYAIFCILGLCMHPFFYSVLVSTLKGTNVTLYLPSWKIQNSI